MKPVKPQPTPIWTRNEAGEMVVQPSARQLSTVTEYTIYGSELSILLRDLLRGKTATEACRCLGVSELDLERYLTGNWKPSKTMLANLGLKIVYAVVEPSGAEVRR